MKSLWMDEGGAVLSVELLLLVVILVIGLITGLVALRDAVVTQLGELALAVAAVDTTFAFDGLLYTESVDGGLNTGTGTTATTANSQRLAIYDATGALDVGAGLAIAGVAATEAKQD